MGITSNDIAAQRAMLARGEEKRKAAKQAAERERLRDTFAAVALPLCTRNGRNAEQISESAYKLADAMLRERGNHSAKPNSSTNHDAVPEARARDADRGRTDKAVTRPGDGTGDTPSPESYEQGDEKRVNTNTNWDATQGECSVRGEGTQTVGQRLVERLSVTQSLLDDNEKLRAEIDRLREAIRRLADQDATLSVQDGSVTVTMDATLTAEEREAVEFFTGFHTEGYGAIEIHAATLRKLLERMK